MELPTAWSRRWNDPPLRRDSGAAWHAFSDTGVMAACSRWVERDPRVSSAMWPPDRVYPRHGKVRPGAQPRWAVPRWKVQRPREGAVRYWAATNSRLARVTILFRAL